MNKSFSKIRHIQEANLSLERRTINEQRRVLNQGIPTTGQTSSTTGQTDGGKAELIEVMINKLNSMAKDPKFTSTAVAQVVYNNAAHFLNKTDIFQDQTKYGKPFPTNVPFAPQG